MHQILVVDDDARLATSLRRVLASEGYRVREARDGPGALEVALTDPPDLVVLDVMLPGIDGVEVCRRLRSADTPAPHPAAHRAGRHRGPRSRARQRRGRVPIVAIAVSALAGRWPMAGRLVDGYRVRTPIERTAVWLLLATAGVHAGLALSADTAAGLLFAAQASLTALAAISLIVGRSWRLLAGIALIASIGGWWVAVLTVEPPDQVGVATKLVEIAALAIVLAPSRAGRLRTLIGTFTILALVVVTDVVAWAGAFAATERGWTEPGTVMAAHIDRPATAQEAVTAEILWRAAAAAIARYEDSAVAISDGYVFDGQTGLDVHAGNPAHESDGRVLDPARPEALVYAQGDRGMVLLGAMFVMPAGVPGPAVGGPLTAWHAHEQVCFSLVPPGFTGLVSPLGGCPIGSIDAAMSADMIHVWTIPGAPSRFGALDDETRQAWVEAHDRGTAGTPST